MKKITNVLLLAGLILTGFYSCQDPDNIVNIVEDSVSKGAVLRVLSVNNSTLNSSEPDSQFSVTVEVQDEKNGELFNSVKIYGTLKDLSEDNGETVIEDVLIKEIPASSFGVSENHGLPFGDVYATYSEIASAMGLNDDNVLPGDVVIIRLELVLTDGRTFSSNNTGVSVTGGAYFNSPFLFNALILCTPQYGDYTVVMHDAYGDGWQTINQSGGPGLIIMMDDVEVQVGICTIWETPSYDCVPGNGSGNGSVPDSNVTAIVTVPEGTQVLTWELPGDSWGEISFEIYGPNGDLIYERPIGGDLGLLPVLLCL